MAVTTRPGASGALVAAGHPATAAAAAEVLRAGGNAFDAVVAAGFASTVAEPGLTSLAGGGFCLARTASGEEVLVDFFVDTPGRGRVGAAVPSFDEVVISFEAATQAFHCGPGSIAVPGVLPGYLHLHRRFGRLDRTAVVGPAARMAARGVELLDRQAGIVALLEPILTRTEASRAIFAPKGRLLRAGDTLRNPDLAHVLDALGASDALSFSTAPLHDALLAVTAEHGLLTADDLAAYRVVERTPLEVHWQGRRVLTNPGPSFGGTLITAALRRLQEDVLTAGDPCAPAAVVEAAADVDRHRHALLEGLDPDDTDRPQSTRGTTHISVWDGEGGAAAMTTSNGECSGDVIAGTGILTNNVLGEDDLHPDGFHVTAPGLRVASMMSPTLVVGAHGDTEVILGSGGSKRIRAAITQVLANVVVHGLDPGAAVEAPRVHWDGDHAEAEPGMAAEAMASLERLGPVHTWPERSVYFGGAHLVVPGVGAAGDPRRDGAAVAP